MTPKRATYAMRPILVRGGVRSATALVSVAVSLLFAKAACAESFTLVVMPDTQSEATNTPQVKFPAMTQWIVDNRASMNIKFVAQVGDLVNWETPDSTPPQFQYVNADKAMHTLDVVGIPYAIAIGNHDTAAVGGANADGTPCHCGGSAAPGNVHANLRNTTTFNQFFPLSRFIDSRGQYEASKVDNQYHTFSAGGLDWLVISSELDPRPGAVAWFNQVVSDHPDHNVIYLTHNFLAPSGDLAGGVGYGDQSPQAVWDGLIKTHANIRFVLSGHLTQTALRQTAGNSGKPVYQLLTDYQDEGNGWLRTLVIDPQAKTVKSQVYSPYLKQYKTGATEEFTLTGVDLVPAKPPSTGGAGGAGNGGRSSGGAAGSGGGGAAGRAGAGGRASGGMGTIGAGGTLDAGEPEPTDGGGGTGTTSAGGGSGAHASGGASGIGAGTGGALPDDGNGGTTDGHGGGVADGSGGAAASGKSPSDTDGDGASCGCTLADTGRHTSAWPLAALLFAVSLRRRRMGRTPAV